MVIDRRVKAIMALAAIAVILLFSQMTTGTLLGVAIGAGLILLGLASYYRPACLAGLVIAAGSAAMSNNPGSLTVIASWLNAVFGLFIPVYVLTWVALSSGAEDPYGFVLRSRANTYTAMFILACLLSVPIAALVIGLLAPQVSTAASVLMEIAIILTVATAGVIILTAQKPRSGGLVERSPETESD
jgi:hypothetical protein